MLRNPRDIQALVYLLLQTGLVILLWQYGFQPLVYAAVLLLSVGISAAHHNHAHLRFWHNKYLNRLTDLWLTLLQGHPTFVFHATHNANHHRYHHGPRDAARTYRFGGDTNHLSGYLLHPLQAVCVLYPLFIDWLRRLRHRAPGVYRHCLLQYLIIITLWAVLAAIDWQKWLLFVLLPQLHGLHWLLATNYLQHAHADGHSQLNFSRNFNGLLNLLMFNIGYHTAHHLHPKAHWSTLPALHEQYRLHIHPNLLAGGLLPYMVRTYLLAPFIPACRSRSLMNHTEEN
ncbi:fatty acid desaturase [Chitinimonas sp. BJYL2]|uniref:fatty acid desaturase family protein n=1 Tax=Chitinimonas sp. BJYL2 TaxID=2976696 RepID=UPI0022B5C18F|nr:fatty acid desaturase [Chitinimonas sp. BJYL2]